MTHDPITLVSPTVPVPRTLLDAPGGFLWWYLDLLDASGTGIVVIWSFGLPFLPGYLASQRADSPQLPRERPSLNLVLYEQGRPTFYLLQEFLPEEVSWQAETSWRFGKNHIVREDDRLWLTLDGVVPGGCSYRGQIEVTGTLCRPVTEDPHGEASPHAHGWTPLLMPAHGTAEIELGDGTRFQCRGRAYHDRNSSGVPLNELGIDEWFWGRAAYEDEERILYQVRGPTGTETIALTLDASGDVQWHRDVQAILEPAGKARYGMNRYTTMDVTVQGQPFMHLDIAAPLDDGPFYLRSFLRHPDTQQPCGFCEVVSPARVDRDGHRPFVRMRVHHTHHKNSLFLPLFAGHPKTRWRRLARHIMGGARAD